MAGLTTAPASGSQDTTQNPQTVPSQSLGGASTQSSGVQPGTSRSVLTSNNGVSLHSTALTTVNIGATTSATTQTPKAATTTKHHINAGLLGASIALIVIAVVSFWIISRTAKNTTD